MTKRSDQVSDPEPVSERQNCLLAVVIDIFCNCCCCGAVADAPRVEVGLGKSISANTVYEGGDVYFDCRVEARPPAHRITWIHNVSLHTPHRSAG